MGAPFSTVLLVLNNGVASGLSQALSRDILFFCYLRLSGAMIVHTLWSMSIFIHSPSSQQHCEEGRGKNYGHFID